MRMRRSGAGSPRADLVLMALEDKTAAQEMRRDPADYMDEDDLYSECVRLYICHKNLEFHRGLLIPI